MTVTARAAPLRRAWGRPPPAHDRLHKAHAPDVGSQPAGPSFAGLARAGPQ